jgi:hypothetical protein
VLKFKAKQEGEVDKIVKEFSDRINNEEGIKPDISDKDKKTVLDEIKEIY